MSTSGTQSPVEEASPAEKALSAAGRVGLAGRTAFYALLVFLTVRIAVLGTGSGEQGNVHGALGIVSQPFIGKVAIAAIALGFVLFGIGRLIGAARSGPASRWRRAPTALQGAFYIGLAYVPASFLAGNGQAGSEESQHRTTAKLLGLPAGQELVVVLGLLVIVVCSYQIRGAALRHFADGLDLDGSARWVHRLVDIAGVVGITSRALVFVPTGVFFVVAAVE